GLKRIYDSSQSEIYTPDARAVDLCSCRVYFNGYVFLEKTKFDGNVDRWLVQRGRYYMIADNMQDAFQLNDYILNHRGKEIYSTGWSGPDANGYYTREVNEVELNSQTSFEGYPIGVAWRNTIREKSPSPLGRGWSWNVPNANDSIITLLDGRTYSSDYPWYD